MKDSISPEEKDRIRVTGDTWTARMANKYLFRVLVQLGNIPMTSEQEVNPFALLPKDLIALLVDWVYGRHTYVRDENAMITPEEHLLSIFPSPEHRNNFAILELFREIGRPFLCADPVWTYALLRVFPRRSFSGPFLCAHCGRASTIYRLVAKHAEHWDIQIGPALSKMQQWALQQLRGIYCNICAVQSIGLQWLSAMGAGGQGYFHPRQILVRVFPREMVLVASMPDQWVNGKQWHYYCMLTIDRLRLRKEAADPGRRVPEN